jgi:hypothetical protein
MLKTTASLVLICGRVPGTHTSAVAFRLQDFVIPFFSKNLEFEQPKR